MNVSAFLWVLFFYWGPSAGLERSDGISRHHRPALDIPPPQPPRPQFFLRRPRDLPDIAGCPFHDALFHLQAPSTALRKAPMCPPIALFFSRCALRHAVFPFPPGVPPAAHCFFSPARPRHGTPPFLSDVAPAAHRRRLSPVVLPQRTAAFPRCAERRTSHMIPGVPTRNAPPQFPGAFLCDTSPSFFLDYPSSIKFTLLTRKRLVLRSASAFITQKSLSLTHPR